MFTELIEKERSITETATPTLGGTNIFGDEELKKKLPNLKVRYGSYNLSDNNDITMLEHIMTTSLKCAEALENPGDLVVVQEQINTNRDGDYIVMVKYIEVADNA